MIQLSPWALGTVDDLLRHLQRNKDTSDQDRDNAIVAGNGAISWMERRTKRRLRARTYRDQVAITGTWLTTAKTVTAIASTANIKVHDTVLGAGMQTGTRVVSVDSATQITLSELPLSAGTGAALTVGSQPLVFHGNGTSELWINEYPVIAVYSAAYRDSSGSATDLDLTGAVLDQESGLYILPAGFPLGRSNILIECAAGYQPPSATVAWDENWSNLQRLWFRATEVLFLDQGAQLGRRTSRHVQNTDIAFDWKMPDDIELAIEAYARKP